MTSLQIKPLKQMVCVNGLVELYPDRVVIHKNGLLSRLFAAFQSEALTIPLYQLENVKAYPTMLTLFPAQAGSITLFFHYESYPMAREMRDSIEDLMSRQHVLPELREKLGHA